MSSTKTKDYDLNIWMSDENRLTVLAYRLVVDAEGFVSCDTSAEPFEVFDFYFDKPEDLPIIAYLLEDETIQPWSSADYVGYDEWLPSDFFVNPPAVLAEFIDQLPEYEMKNYYAKHA